MTEIVRVDKPIAYYQMPTPEGCQPTDILRVSEVVARDGVLLDTLNVCATGIAQIMRTSWYEKMVMKDVMTYANVDSVLKSPYQQRCAIEQANPKTSRYFVTSATGYSPIKQPEDIRAVLRVEAHQPKMPVLGNWALHPYPNITDLETMSGVLAAGEHHYDALALVQTVVSEAVPSRKIAAYTERENPDGIRFFEDLGFVDLGATGRHADQRVSVGTRYYPEEPAARVSVGYVHMEARRAEPVQHYLNVAIGRYLAD